MNEQNFQELGKIDIDHFIPWSYVTSDEIWNLTPTFSSVNRSKNNQLPNQKADIIRLSAQHYKAFRISQGNKELGALFRKFKGKHLNREDLEGKLYHPDIGEAEFCNQMYEVLNPIYLSACNVGFEDWKHRVYTINDFE